MSYLTKQQRQHAEFFVKLLYLDLDSPDEDWESFCESWRHLEGISYWPEEENAALREPLSEEWVHAAAQWIREHLKERKQHPEQRVGFHPGWLHVYPSDLRDVQQITRNVIFGLLWDGWAEAESKVSFILKLTKDGKVQKRVKSEDAHSDMLLLILLPLLEHRPFPFGKCAVCPQVFVQEGGRGKPRRYCFDPACKAKGVPSAATAIQTEYKRRQRQKQWDKELREVRRVLRTTHSEQEQLEQLSKMEMFQQKSRRALVQLLNKVRRRQKRTKRTEGKED